MPAPLNTTGGKSNVQVVGSANSFLRRIVNVALGLWTVSADLKAGERTVFRARQQIDLAKPFN